MVPRRYRMIERFTSRGRQAVVDAQEEARQSHYDHVEPQHLLLGCLRSDTRIAELFESVGARADWLRGQLPSASHDTHSPESLGFSDSAKAVLEAAWHESRDRGHAWVDPGHISIAILRDRQGLVSRALANNGVEQERLVDSIDELLKDLPVDVLTQDVSAWAQRQAQAHHRVPDGGDVLEAVLALDPLALAATERLGVKPQVLRATLEELRSQAGPLSRAPWNIRS